MDTSTSIIERLPAVLEQISTAYPESSLGEARRVYGSQVTTSFHTLRYLLRGLYPTADIQKWHQANQMVCSGTTPAGTPADFGERHEGWSRKVEERRTEFVVTDLTMIMFYTPLVSSSSHRLSHISFPTFPFASYLRASPYTTYVR